MCPSETHIIEVGQAHSFGPATPVFQRESYCPCSINLKDSDIEDKLIIQVRRDGSHWFDYEPGQMIIGRDVECRLAVINEMTHPVEVEVFYN